MVAEDDADEMKPESKMESPPTVSVELAEKWSETWKGAETVEEAEEMNPPSKSASPENDDVEEAERWSETWKGAETVEEAEEMNPLSVVSPSTARVEVAENAPPTVSASFMNPAPCTAKRVPGLVVPMPTEPEMSAKSEFPSTAMDEEEVRTSDTWRGPETVLDPWEISPKLKTKLSFAESH